MAARPNTAGGPAPAPWSPPEATSAINALAMSPELTLSYKVHATKRRAERGITTGDVLYALKKGTVLNEPTKESTRPGCYKYVVESSTPNSGKRLIHVVVAAMRGCKDLKIITVYWKDEPLISGDAQSTEKM